MGRRLLLVVGLATILVATGADAQLAGLIGRSVGLPVNGEVGGSYKGGDRVRTFVASDPRDVALTYGKLVEKALLMAEARGFARIGVTRHGCMSAVVGGSIRSTSCYVAAVMLNAGGVLDRQGDRDVHYVGREDLRQGMIAPPSN